MACFIEQAVGPLVSCSSDCVISLDQLDYTCSDNGTPADPSDDFYTININASSINGSLNNTYNVLLDNILTYNFPYDVTSTFTLPGNGNSPLVTIVDNQSAGCETSQVIGPLVTCSNDCILNAFVSNILCNDEGTSADDTDDTYTFELMVSGQNLSQGWQTTDGNYTGTYGQVQQLGPFLITDGNMALEITDNVNQTCVIIANAAAPLACSSCGQTVDAGPGTILDCLNGTAQLDGSASDPGTYTWTGPNSFQENTLSTTTTEPGWYVLTADFNAGCLAVDSVLIEMNNDLPTSDAGPDQTLSCDVLEIELQGSGSTANGTTSYEWFNSINQSVSQTQTLSTSVPGIYTLVITDDTNGCSISDQVEVFENNEAPNAQIIDPDILTCDVDSVTLDGSLSTGIGTLSFEWQDANSNVLGFTPTVVVSAAGNYLLIVTDTDNNCVSSAPIEVLINGDIL